jgi:hypothetical protein
MKTLPPILIVTDCGHFIAYQMTLVAELDVRCFRHIAERIISVIGQFRGTWAFAAPSEINGAILDGLPKGLKDRLKLNLARDLTHTPAIQLCNHFLKTREEAMAS